MNGKVAATTGALVVLLILTLGAEAELCKTRSRSYRGRCIHNLNCAAVCVTEGCTGGFCHGDIHRVCMCTKDCGGEGGGGDEPPAASTARAGGHA